MLNFLWPKAPFRPTDLTYFTGEMLKVFFLQKKLKTGEMLNLLNFLGLEAPFRPTGLTDFVCLLSLLSLSISLSLSLSLSLFLYLSLPPSFPPSDLAVILASYLSF